VHSGPLSGSAAACQWTTVTAFVVLLRVADSLLLLASEAATGTSAAVRPRPPLRHSALWATGIALWATSGRVLSTALSLRAS
jgi:hypothetical protein